MPLSRAIWLLDHRYFVGRCIADPYPAIGTAGHCVRLGYAGDLPFVQDISICRIKAVDVVVVRLDDDQGIVLPIEAV